MSEQIQITWNVTSLDRFSNLSGYSDVVYSVHWDCIGSYSGVSGEHKSRTYDITYLDVSEVSGNFIPYYNLTSNQVLDWTWDKMGQDQKNVVEQVTTMKITEQIRPSILSSSPPW